MRHSKVKIGDIFVPDGTAKQSNYYSLGMGLVLRYEGHDEFKIMEGTTYNNYWNNSYDKGYCMSLYHTKGLKLKHLTETYQIF